MAKKSNTHTDKQAINWESSQKQSIFKTEKVCLCVYNVTKKKNSNCIKLKKCIWFYILWRWWKMINFSFNFSYIPTQDVCVCVWLWCKTFARQVNEREQKKHISCIVKITYTLLYQYPVWSWPQTHTSRIW